MLTLLLLSALALAGPDEKKEGDNAGPPPVKVSGQLFAHYELRLTDGADNFNEFALDRAYFRADGTINDHLGARITLDADRFKADTTTGVAVDTKYRMFIKHAYLEWKDPAPGVKARFGVVDTPLGPYMDDFWNHRYIADNYASWSVGISTADLGVGAYGNHNKGLVNWAAVLVNGEGYSKIETDSGKTVQARVSVDPLAGGDKMKLPITGFVSYALNPDDNQALIASGALGFEMPYLLFSGQFLMMNQAEVTGQGFSIIAIPRMPKVLNVVARYDAYDSNTDDNIDGKTKLIGGLAHNFTPKVSAAVTYEQEVAEDKASTTDVDESATVNKGVFVHMQAGF